LRVIKNSENFTILNKNGLQTKFCKKDNGYNKEIKDESGITLAVKKCEPNKSAKMYTRKESVNILAALINNIAKNLSNIFENNVSKNGDVKPVDDFKTSLKKIME
jgi:hypothetical protein